MRVLCVLLGILLSAFSAGAQNATWLSNPGSNDLDVGSNWSTGTVPTGTASFGVSNTTTLVSSGFGNTFGGWTFNAGASAYSISLTPNGGNLATEFVGAGIAINGGSVSIINSRAFNALYFANSSTAGAAQITNSGSLNFVNSSSAGTAVITNSFRVQFSNSSSADHATITNQPGGGITFFENSTASNATILNNSIASGIPFCFGCSISPGLGFRNSSTADNATIITQGGTTQFFDQSSGGNARFISVSGSVDFSNTLGPIGDGKVSAGSIEGSGNYFLGSRELTVGSNNLSTNVTGAINDGGACIGPLGGPCLGGSLVKVGTGMLILSGTNTYSGATTINGGVLSVEGSIASSSMTIVNAGGVLTGTGVVGNTMVNGGSFMPGNGAPGSSMTIAGNLGFQSGAIYFVQINPATSSFTNVSGAATLGSATVNAAFANGSYVEKQYMILTAGSISGTFNPTTANTNLPSGFHTSLNYDATHAYLNLALNFVPTSGQLNVNQQSVGNALINFFNSNGSIPLVFGALTPAGLTQLSGESATGTQQTTFDAMNLFMGLLTDPFISGRGNPVGIGGGPTGYADETLAYGTRQGTDAFAMHTKVPPPSFGQRWSVWAAGFGGSQRTDGSTVLGSNDTRSSIYGTAVGVDYRLSPNTLAGFALAGGGTNFSVNTLGYGRSDLFQAGGFIRQNFGPAYVTGALAYGWQDIITDRIVTVAGLDHLHAEFNANAWSGRVEGGYRFLAPIAGGVGVTPYAAGQFVTFDLPAYMEHAIIGNNTFALGYNAKSVTDPRTELGLRTDKSFALSNGILTLRGRLAWAHDFDPDRALLATFQTLPGASFVVNGAAQAHDSALTTASAEWKWLSGWSAAATFEGEFANVARSYAGKGVVRYAW